MEQLSSKKGNEQKLKNAFPDSPLEIMLTQWEENPLTPEKDQNKIIQYCMLKWPERKIRMDGLYWPRHGSTEPWLCQALYCYVHFKTSIGSDEKEYAEI